MEVLDADLEQIIKNRFTVCRFYEGAAAARGNRKHDRNVMIFGISGQDETCRDDSALRGSYSWSWP